MGTVSANIISYIEMCRREGASLQQGMNFGLGGNHSVILMSVRPNAPYRDQIEDSGITLIYEGHDMPQGALRSYSAVRKGWYVIDRGERSTTLRAS